LRAVSPLRFRRISRKVIRFALIALSLACAVPAVASERDARVAARARGTDLATAQTVARALLAHPLGAQLLRVRCERLGAHRICGLTLSGTKFHHPLDRTKFLAEVRLLVTGAFAAAPIDEVDLWATVPLDAGHGAVVSGDAAKPTSATVFSVTVPKAALAGLDRQLASGIDVFWDSEFSASLAKGGSQ
jgi:hypothetical protein